MQLLASMTSPQLTGWLAYAEIEPFGEARADLRMGILASLMANINRDPKKKPEPFAPIDFMPYAERPKRTAAQVLRAALGHLVVKKKG